MIDHLKSGIGQLPAIINSIVKKNVVFLIQNQELNDVSKRIMILLFILSYICVLPGIHMNMLLMTYKTIFMLQIVNLSVRPVTIHNNHNNVVIYYRTSSQSQIKTLKDKLFFNPRDIGQSQPDFKVFLDGDLMIGECNFHHSLVNVPWFQDTTSVEAACAVKGG